MLQTSPDLFRTHILDVCTCSLLKGDLNTETRSDCIEQYRAVSYGCCGKPRYAVAMTTSPTWEFPRIRDTLFWGPSTKYPAILDTRLGFPIL